MKKYRLGIDIGSKTAKLVLLDEKDKVVFSQYSLHKSNVLQTFSELLGNTIWRFGNHPVQLCVTGSSGIRFAQDLAVPYAQEVIASRAALKTFLPSVDVAIELGGEDAKILFLRGGVEERMNGSCAGGTGGFLDVMCGMLGVRAHEFNSLASSYSHIYPIASRCAVFAQADVRPLINAGARKSDIAASVMQAIVTQTISGLACGRSIEGNVAFLGGPCEVYPELVQRFRRTLGLSHAQTFKPEKAHLFVASGAALLAGECAMPVPGAGEPASLTLQRLKDRIDALPREQEGSLGRLPRLFNGESEYLAFKERHGANRVARSRLMDHEGAIFLGVDAGSTTLKLAAINAEGALLYTAYENNKGDVVEVARQALDEFLSSAPREYDGTPLTTITRSLVCGYGENLLKAAFRFDSGEVETVAHLRAAREVCPDATFVLDIGGQDIKCLRLRDGQISDILLNEACSSGCGALISGFARSLGHTKWSFAKEALQSTDPVDLGTRCTVFMTSRVRHAQKEGVDTADISAGLAYSVVRNALYKVMGMSTLEHLGKRVVVQGGTFMNDAVLRVFELESGLEVVRPDIANLMGAYGAALLARDEYLALGEMAPPSSSLLGSYELATLRQKQSNLRCEGCTNACNLAVSSFFFADERPPKGALYWSTHPQVSRKALGRRWKEAVDSDGSGGSDATGTTPVQDTLFVSGNRCERGPLWAAEKLAQSAGAGFPVKQEEQEARANSRKSSEQDITLRRMECAEPGTAQNSTEFAGSDTIPKGTEFAGSDTIPKGTEIARPGIAQNSKNFAEPGTAQDSREHSESDSVRESRGRFGLDMPVPAGAQTVTDAAPHTGNRIANLVAYEQKQLMRCGARSQNKKGALTQGVSETSASGAPSLSSSRAAQNLVGIPPVLSLFDEYPYWRVLFSELGFSVLPLTFSSGEIYRTGAGSVLSESVCYPAKLMHGHIRRLISEGADYVFMPTFVRAQLDEGHGGKVRCPVVSGYGHVAAYDVESTPRNPQDPLGSQDSLNKARLLAVELAREEPDVEDIRSILSQAGVSSDTSIIQRALAEAATEKRRFLEKIWLRAEEALRRLEQNGGIGIVLLGHPYHTDPGINHGIDRLLVDLGYTVFSTLSLERVVAESSASQSNSFPFDTLPAQNWPQAGTLYNTAAYVANHPCLHAIQLHSFGCGVDALTTASIRKIIQSAGKPYTAIKLDEMVEPATLRIRLRSLAYALSKSTSALSIDGHVAAIRKKRFSQNTPPNEIRSLEDEQTEPAHVALPALLPEDIKQGLASLDNDLCFQMLGFGGQILRYVEGRQGVFNFELPLLCTDCRGAQLEQLLNQIVPPDVTIVLNTCRSTAFLETSREFIGEAAGVKIDGKDSNSAQYPQYRVGNPLCCMSRAVPDVTAELRARQPICIVLDASDGKVSAGSTNEVSNLFDTDPEGEIPAVLSDSISGSSLKSCDMVPITVAGSSLTSLCHAPRIGVLGNAAMVLTPEFNDVLLQRIHREGAVPVLPPLSEIFASERPLLELLPQLYEQGIRDYVYVQSFGCLRSHVNARGLLPRIKQEYPDCTITILEYDPGVSQINQLSRLKLAVTIALERIADARTQGS